MWSGLMPHPKYLAPEDLVIEKLEAALAEQPYDDDRDGAPMEAEAQTTSGKPGNDDEAATGGETDGCRMEGPQKFHCTHHSSTRHLARA
jgi:hypothetical protein